MFYKIIFPVVFLFLSMSAACQQVEPTWNAYRWLNKDISTIKKELNGIEDESGDVTVATSTKTLILERDGEKLGFGDGKKIGFIVVEFTHYKPCSMNKDLNSEIVLQLVGLKKNSLEQVVNYKNSHVFMDHKNKLRVGVICKEEGVPLEVSFSGRYYKK